MATEVKETTLDKLLGEPEATYYQNRLSQVKYTANRRREVIFEIDQQDQQAERDFFISLDDDQYDTLHIPLGRFEKRPENDVRTELESDGSSKPNVLVPIVPLCYASNDLDPQKAQAPSADGFIYIFKDGYLWRELHVLEAGLFRDVNLTHKAGLNNRMPSAREPDNRILLPHKLAGQTTVIEMCFSPVQWSWARVNAMGGMAANDPRLTQRQNDPIVKDHLFPSAEQQTNATALREARCQVLDLTGYSQGFPVQQACGRNACIGNIKTAPNHYALDVVRRSNIAVVYLHDPIGIANRLMLRFQEKRAQLMLVMDEMQGAVDTQSADYQAMTPKEQSEYTANAKRQAEAYQCATLASQIFFNERLWEVSGKGRQMRYTNKNKHLRQAADEIDKDELRAILHAEERMYLRADMRELKNQLVQWLNDHALVRNGIVTKHPPTTMFARTKKKHRLIYRTAWTTEIDSPAADICEDYIPINTALADLTSAEGLSLAVAQNLLNGLFSVLVIEPLRHIDKDQDLEMDIVTELPAEADDPGLQYLAELLEPDHPLHVCLFPKIEQCDPYSANPPDLSGINDGSGAFNIKAFYEVYNNQFNGASHLVDNIYESLRDKLLDYAHDILTTRVQLFQMAYMAVRVHSFKREAINGYVLMLAKAVEPELKEALLMTADPDNPDWVIWNGRYELTEKLKKQQLEEQIKKLENQPDGLKSHVVLDPNTGQMVRLSDLLAHVDEADHPNIINQLNRGVISEWKAIALILWAMSEGNEGLAQFKTAGKVLHVGANSQALQKLLEQQADDIDDLKISKLVMAKRLAIPSVLGVLEVFNIYGTILDLADSKSLPEYIKNGVSASLAFTTLGLIATDAYVNVYQQGWPGAAFYKRMQTELTWGKTLGLEVKITKLARLNIFVTLAIAGTDIWNACDYFSKKDNYAAIASLGSGSLALASLGYAIFGRVLFGAPQLVFLGMGMIGWGLLIASIIISLMIASFEDTPIEEWAKWGPFSLDKEERLTGEYKHWQNFVAAYNGLLGYLITPRVEFRLDDKAFLAEIPQDPNHTPFGPYISQAPGSLQNRYFALDVVTPGMDHRTLNVTANCLRTEKFVDNDSWIHDVFTDNNQRHLETPVATVDILSADNLQVIGTRFIYKAIMQIPIHPKENESRRQDYQWLGNRYTAKVLITADNGLRLPTLPPEERADPDYQKYAADPLQVDSDEPGFYYPATLSAYPDKMDKKPGIVYKINTTDEPDSPKNSNTSAVPRRRN